MTAWPLAAQAQQLSRKLPIIGYLGTTTAVSQGEHTAAFLRRLHELGWTEGHNIAIEYRWAGASLERAAEFAAELVRQKVDVIHTSGNLYALVAKQATSAIPIVFALAGDPVGIGLVASLARPGGNVTCFSNQLIDAAPKRIELLREVVPGFHRLTVMTIDSASPDRQPLAFFSLLLVNFYRHRPTGRRTPIAEATGISEDIRRPNALVPS